MKDNRMNKLVCMLRVKNGILFIKKWLDNVIPLIDEIVVVDNGSTDGTYEILIKEKKIVDIVRTEGFHEGRDRKILLEMALRRNPDWMILLDVDELFEQRVSRQMLNKMMESKIFKCYGFRLYHLIRNEGRFLASIPCIIELSSMRRHMFKNSPTLFVRDVPIHCGIEGIPKPLWISSIRLFHHANLHKEYRLKVYENYKSIDPGNTTIYNRDIHELIHQTTFTLPIRQEIIWIYFEYAMLNLIYIIRFPFRKILKIIRNRFLH